jgi:UDP-N-acetylmuramoyl-tripeptide--D-alanyl-D-alanine ligase
MMTLREAAAAMQGVLHGTDRPFTSVSTDTRRLAPEALFFAIRGERFDGVQFASQALGAGAAAAVATAEAVQVLEAGAVWIQVDDVRLALGRLAAHWRGKFELPLIAVTGSNGKTTVKEMIAAVLRQAAAASEEVLATEGNLNNDIGMPLTLLKLRARHRYAVIEMGMNHAGEIGYLTHIARPDVALVTNAGAAHIGMLGSLEAIARAKGEIYEGLSEEGVAIVNADDAFAPTWRKQNARRRTLAFGLDAGAEITGRYTGHALDSEIVVRTPAWEAALRLPDPDFFQRARRRPHPGRAEGRPDRRPAQAARRSRRVRRELGPVPRDRHGRGRLRGRQRHADGDLLPARARDGLRGLPRPRDRQP